MPSGTWCVLAVTLSLVSTSALAGPGREWHVRAGAHGNGTAADPLGTVAGAIDLAGPGDVVVLAPGVYEETLVTVRGGTADLPLTVRAATARQPPVVTVSGRVATIAHPHIIIEGLVFDGQFGAADTVRVTSAATGLVLRRVEVRRSSRDCIDMGGPADVTVEHALIHHCLNAAGGRTDAHGIVAANARGLTIRDTDIHTFSGDAIQLDPGRHSPGWTNLLVERCRLWLAPLPAAVNGFAAGIVPGENAIDTKTPPDGARSTLTVVDTMAWGFRDGLINNMAAFNIKERVDATFDRITVSASTIAFRLRGAADAGARVTMTNVVAHSVATAVRYEDDIDTLRVHHATLGRDVGQAFRRVSSPSTVVDVRHLLMLGATLPPEAGPSGLAVSADAFVDVSADDYRLTSGSPAVDRARALPGVMHDRSGVTRPQGAAADVGAFEYCESRCPPTVPTGLRVRQ